MTPNQIIAALLDLLHVVEVMRQQHAVVGQDYVTVRRGDFEQVRTALAALPRLTGATHWETVSDELASFLQANQRCDAEADRMRAIDQHTRVDRPAAIEATPPGMEQKACVAPAAPKSTLSFEDVTMNWLHVKQEFGIDMVKPLLAKFFSVTKLMDIPQSEWPLCVAVATELIMLAPEEVDRLARTSQLNPATWLQERKELRTPPPLEVNMARQVVGNYRNDLRCWFCSATLPPDDVLSSVDERHNEGCAVPMARTILENYNAQQEEF